MALLMGEMPARTCGNPFLTERARSLAVILREEFGVPFAFHDAETGEVVGPLDAPGGEAPAIPFDPATARQLAADDRARVTPRDGHRYQLELPLAEAGKPCLLATGTLTALARTRLEVAEELARLQKWAQAVCYRISVVSLSPCRPPRRAEPEEPGRAWEAVAALDQLLRRLRLHKEPAKNQARILRAAAELLRVQALIWVPRQGSVVVAGDETCLSPWDCQQLAERLLRRPELEKTGFFLCNQVSEFSWGACFPQIENLVAFAVGTPSPSGLVIALNKQEAGARGQAAERRPGRPTDPHTRTPVPCPFRHSDAALLTPFVALLDLHAGASRRFHDLKELLVRLTRSLTGAIDARDPYTCGHSERVGRIAVELGRELGLEDDQVSDLYLAGLLHDIGKIGIRDAVLGKGEPLTVEERKHLQEHVTIGYAILADLHPIQHLLPAVLYHHERYDGAGYPEGLKGNAIPLLARILAVADDCDALSNDSPDGTALPPERVEAILAQGAGTRWDGQVVDAFLRCRQKVHVIRRREAGESPVKVAPGAPRAEDTSLSQVAPPR